MKTVDFLGHSYTLAQVYDWITTYAIPVLSGFYASHWAQWLKTDFNVSPDTGTRRFIIRAFTIVLTAAFCSIATFLVSVKTNQPMSWSIVGHIVLSYLVAVFNYDHRLKS